jgi:hypothetical protein
VAQIRVQRGSNKGAAWLKLGCGLAHMVAHRLAGRQARVRIYLGSAPQTEEDFY